MLRKFKRNITIVCLALLLCGCDALKMEFIYKDELGNEQRIYPQIDIKNQSAVMIFLNLEKNSDTSKKIYPFVKIDGLDCTILNINNWTCSRDVDGKFYEEYKMFKGELERTVLTQSNQSVKATLEVKRYKKRLFVLGQETNSNWSDFLQ